jgi:hypothetical protein
MYSVMRKGAEAKQKLLEHALYKRTLTEQEVVPVKTNEIQGNVLG